MDQYHWQALTPANTLLSFMRGDKYSLFGFISLPFAGDLIRANLPRRPSILLLSLNSVLSIFS